MIKKFFTAIAMIALGTVAFGDEVYNGQKFTLNKRSCTVAVTGNMFNDVFINVTDDTGTSNTVAATPGENSSTTKPSVSSTNGDSLIVRNDDGEIVDEYRVKDGKMQRKNDSGDFVDMGRPRKTDANGDVINGDFGELNLIFVPDPDGSGGAFYERGPDEGGELVPVLILMPDGTVLTPVRDTRKLLRTTY